MLDAACKLFSKIPSSLSNAECTPNDLISGVHEFISVLFPPRQKGHEVDDGVPWRVEGFFFRGLMRKME
jgi:hypothetical protein